MPEEFERAVERTVVDRATECTGVFSREPIARCVWESRNLLRARAHVKTFLAFFVYHFTRERQQALA